MTTSVNISSITKTNKKVTKSITNINPEVNNEDLKIATELFTAISDTTFLDADRIIKMSVNETYTPPPTEEPILEISEFNYDGYRYVATITYNGDGILLVNTNEATAFAQVYHNEESNINQLRIQASPATFSGTLHATAGTIYAAKSIEFAKS